MTTKHAIFGQADGTDNNSAESENTNPEQQTGLKEVNEQAKRNEDSHGGQYRILQSLIPQAASLLGCAIIANLTQSVSMILLIVCALSGVGLAIFGTKWSLYLAPMLPLHKGKLQTFLLVFFCYQTNPHVLSSSATDVLQSLLNGSANAQTYWTMIFALAGSVQMVLGIEALVKSVIAVFRPDLLKEAE
jgi:hypothetical protein